MTTAAFAIPLRSTAGSARQSAHWILRVGAAMCFVGHGAFGFITKASWIPYFGFVGIPDTAALRLMPLVGTVDVAAAIIVLLSPRAFALLYMAVWAAWTALLRPLTGDSAWEAVERAGNYGVPLALLLMSFAPRTAADWWRMRLGQPLGSVSVAKVCLVLRATTVALLLGHGALGIVGSASQYRLYHAVGITDPTIQLLGWFEVLLAIAIAARPAIALLVFAAAWKIATESLWVVSGAPAWEFIERAGSYAAPLALVGLLIAQQTLPRKADRTDRNS